MRPEVHNTIKNEKTIDIIMSHIVHPRIFCESTRTCVAYLLSDYFIIIIILNHVYEVIYILVTNMFSANHLSVQ